MLCWYVSSVWIQKCHLSNPPLGIWTYVSFSRLLRLKISRFPDFSIIFLIFFYFFPIFRYFSPTFNFHPSSFGALTFGAFLIGNIFIVGAICRGFNKIAHISYFYVPMVGFLITMITGSLISLLTGCNGGDTIDPKLMFHFRTPSFIGRLLGKGGKLTLNRNMEKVPPNSSGAANQGFKSWKKKHRLLNKKTHAQ